MYEKSMFKMLLQADLITQDEYNRCIAELLKQEAQKKQLAS